MKFFEFGDRIVHPQLGRGHFIAGPLPDDPEKSLVGGFVEGIMAVKTDLLEHDFGWACEERRHEEMIW